MDCGMTFTKTELLLVDNIMFFNSPCPFKKFIEDLSVRVIVWSIICQRTSLQSFTFKKQH